MNPYLLMDLSAHEHMAMKPYDMSMNICIHICWWTFVCVEFLRPSQPNGVMLSAVSLPNHTFTGQA